VVNPANAESALAYEEAVIPNKKNIPTASPSSLKASRGNSSSVAVGMAKL
jgi:hypothetical protein